jgi:hypothetical protein
MSLTIHWSQRPCLSHFVLTHELRQAWLRLSFDVSHQKQLEKQRAFCISVTYEHSSRNRVGNRTAF